MSKEFWKKYGILFGIWGILILMFSFSGLFGLTFFQLFPVLASLPALLVSYLWVTYDDLADSEEVIDLKKVISDFEEILEEQVKIQAEQVEVIKEYEEIFDLQLVELPCVCGGNTFKGLFSPKLENIVVCEKCNGEYRVQVNYESTLLSAPMDGMIG